MMFVEQKNEFETTAEEFRRFREQMRDPLVIGTMLHKLSEERASSNLVIREINAKLDRLLSLEERLSSLEARLQEGSKAKSSSAQGTGARVEAGAGSWMETGASAKMETGMERAHKPFAAEVLLPEVDEQIVSFVKRKRHVNAEDVQKEFAYKGTNAASSRLNRLVREGVLQKKQVGRKVVFTLIE